MVQGIIQNIFLSVKTYQDSGVVLNIEISDVFRTHGKVFIIFENKKTRFSRGNVQSVDEFVQIET